MKQQLSSDLERARRTRLVGFATKGSGSNEEDRLRELTRNFDTTIVGFDRAAKVRSFFAILRAIRDRRPSMVMMEGSGVAGGFAALLGRFLLRVPFVVSSGDAVAPFLTARLPLLRPAFALYERALCRACAGFVGWTPYLVGRALSLGAARAMTAEGWAPFPLTSSEREIARSRVRRRLDIPDDALVAGIAGALMWSRRFSYCYGLELISALRLVRRPDLVALIVGDGNGRGELERAAGAMLGKQVFFVGQIEQRELPAYLAAMDIASLPQSVDKVGSFRYSTKLSEYIDAGLPLVTGEIPLAYDLDDGWLWRLPGTAPWDRRYIESLARLLEVLSRREIETRKTRIPRCSPQFSKDAQVARVTAFLLDLIDSDSIGPRSAD